LLTSLAVRSAEFGFANARVRVDAVHAGSAVQTGINCTFVGIFRTEKKQFTKYTRSTEHTYSKINQKYKKTKQL